MNDKRLIIRLKKQDEKAIEKIIDEFSGYVYTISKNIIGEYMSQEDVEEVVSDCFMCLWNNAERLDEEKPISPYLATITRNISRNRLRQMKNDVPIDELVNFLQDKEDIENNFEITEKTHILLEYLDKLNQIDKEIFIRFYFYNEKLEQVSSKLGITLSNCKTKLHRTRTKIKIELTERGYGYEKEK